MTSLTCEWVGSERVRFHQTYSARTLACQLEEGRVGDDRLPGGGEGVVLVEERAEEVPEAEVHLVVELVAAEGVEDAEGVDEELGGDLVLPVLQDVPVDVRPQERDV